MKDLYIVAGDGSFARIAKKTLQLTEEAKLQGVLKGLVTNDSDRVFISSSKCILYMIDYNDFSAQDHLISTHSTPIKDIAFPCEFSAVFATCAGSEIRVWNVAN